MGDAKFEGRMPSLRLRVDHVLIAIEKNDLGRVWFLMLLEYQVQIPDRAWLQVRLRYLTGSQIIVRRNISSTNFNITQVD